MDSLQLFERYGEVLSKNRTCGLHTCDTSRVTRGSFNKMHLITFPSSYFSLKYHASLDLPCEEGGGVVNAFM